MVERRRVRHRLPKVPRIAWKRLLEPGKPVRLPRYADTALRLMAVSVQPRGAPTAGQKSRKEKFAELQLIRKTSGAEDHPSRQRFALWRFRARRSAWHARPLQALLNCSDWNTYLSAVGYPLLVLGTLEGALTPLQKTQAADDTPAEEQSTGILRPNNVDEFYDAVEAHLRQNGRTTMRRLGNFVALPPGGQSLKLKKLLLERRDRFIIDLSGSVEINHSRRWRWSSQGLVTKRRRTAAR